MAIRIDLPYGRHQIDEDDIAAVVEVLRSDWLTTGPVVDRFEEALAAHVGASHSVALSSGTAALHAAMFAIGVGPGDEVIVPSMTFAATANAVVYQGGTPVFADIDPETLLLDSSGIEALITRRTKAIIAVDYAGQPCNYDLLRQIAKQHDLLLVADASHSLGAEFKGRQCGTLADLTTFSFHPVKPLTTAEGGMVVTEHIELVQRMRQFRNHGINIDFKARQKQGDWLYEISQLGYNYRISDLQCALGLSQLKKLDSWLRIRRQFADRYSAGFSGHALIRPLEVLPNVKHGYHLFVVRIPSSERARIFAAMRKEGIGVNVHYLPVHLHPFYRKEFKTDRGLCQNAERVYGEILSLPIFPGMHESDVERVVICLTDLLS